MNYKSLSYRQKNKYLLIAVICFLPLVYFLAVKKTKDLFIENSMLESKVEFLEKAPSRMQKLEARNKLMTEKLSSYFAGTEREEEHLLEVITNFCNKNRLLLRTFPKVKEDEGNEFVVINNEVKVEGDFINLLKLVYELEQKTQAGRLTSISFDSFFDNKRKKQVLVLSLYLQTLKIKSDVQ
ncbi:MAG: hypothetical protein ACK40G_01155 [Cytophagaceae bacterium]